MKENENEVLQNLYTARFQNGDSKKSMWYTLCHCFFQKYIREESTIVDVAAGYCEFINNISAKEKIAFDLNPDVVKYADKDVKVINQNVMDISSVLEDNTIDYFFISNFLEHMNSKEDIIELIAILERKLKQGGKILILQPNIRYVKEAYWDFIDHKMPLTEKALQEVAEMNNLQVETCIKKFLPYTTKSKLPKADWIIKLYIQLMPVSGLFFGKQTFMVLKK